MSPNRACALDPIRRRRSGLCHQRLGPSQVRVRDLQRRSEHQHRCAIPTHRQHLAIVCSSPPPLETFRGSYSGVGREFKPSEVTFDAKLLRCSGQQDERRRHFGSGYR